MNPLCRIELLGGLRVIQDGRVISRFQTQKTAALLAYIALHKGRSFPREFIAELLWPDGDPTAIRNRLNQAVSSLRRQLHPPGSEPGYVIDADHSKIAINPKTITTDIEVFQAAMRRSQDADDETIEMNSLIEAVNVYGGDFLDGYYEEWALLERVRLADLYTHALSRLIRLHADKGRLTEAIEIASKRLSLDPLEERNHRALMRLYVMAGRPQSAMLQFEELDRALASDGRTPSAKAMKLLESAKESSSGSGPIDQPLPMEGTVLVEEDAPEPRPAAKRPTVEPSSTLPRYVTNFVGREAELASLIEAIQQGHRLVTLTGLGGIGKTRLAVEAAWRLSAEFAENVVFVSVQGLSKFDDVYAQISRAVRRVYGLTPDLDIEITDEVPAIGQFLMVVDNVEDVDEDTIAWFNDRLSRYHSMSVVMTGRGSVGLHGEMTIPLAPLPLPEMEATTTLQDLAENPAVSLFVSRARIARHDFQITERTASAIVKLCRRLEGWPLALELAAGWSRTLTPTQMVEQVTQQYDRLASRRRDIAERHRSMSAVLDGSFEILEEEYRDALKRLIVFKGGFEHEAAEHVCPGVDTLAVLQELEERNWIISSFNEGRVRFWMLETLRAYLGEQVTEATRMECAWLHAGYYSQLVQQTGSLPRELWNSIVLDHRNIRAAFDFYIEQKTYKDALELIVAFAPMLDMAGGTMDSLACYERIEPQFDSFESEHPALVARARAGFGHELLVARDNERAEKYLVEARESFLKIGDEVAELNVRIDLANVSHTNGDYAASTKAFEGIEREAVKHGHLVEAARSATGLGNGFINMARYAEAEAPLNRAVEYAREAADATRISTALQSLARVAMIQGDLDKAKAMTSEAISLAERIGHRHLWGFAQIGMAQVDRLMGDWKSAGERLVLVLRSTVQMHPFQIEVLIECLHVLGHFERDETIARIFGFISRRPEYRRIWEEEAPAVGGIELVDRVKERLGPEWDRAQEEGKVMSVRDLHEQAARELRPLLEAL